MNFALQFYTQTPLLPQIPRAGVSGDELGWSKLKSAKDFFVSQRRIAFILLNEKHPRRGYRTRQEPCTLKTVQRAKLKMRTELTVTTCVSFSLPCSALDCCCVSVAKERKPQSSQRNHRTPLQQLPKNRTGTPICLHLGKLGHSVWLHGWRSHFAFIGKGRGGE
jgi:hypothetical protein